MALLPIHENINGKNWLEVKSTAPAAIDPVGPDTALGSISQSLKDMAMCSAERKDLDDMKKLVLMSPIFQMM